MSSGTVREKAVSRSCILAPEGPVAWRAGGRHRGHTVSGAVACGVPPPLPQGPSVQDRAGRGPRPRRGCRRRDVGRGAWAPGAQLPSVGLPSPPRPQSPATVTAADTPPHPPMLQTNGRGAGAAPESCSAPGRTAVLPGAQSRWRRPQNGGGSHRRPCWEANPARGPCFSAGGAAPGHDTHNSRGAHAAHGVRRRTVTQPRKERSPDPCCARDEPQTRNNTRASDHP